MRSGDSARERHAGSRPQPEASVPGRLASLPPPTPPLCPGQDGARPQPALTTSPGCAGPRSCGSPGAGFGCYEDACVGRKDGSAGCPQHRAGGRSEGADGGSRRRLKCGQNDPTGPALDSRDKVTGEARLRKAQSPTLDGPRAALLNWRGASGRGRRGLPLPSQRGLTGRG